MGASRPRFWIVRLGAGWKHYGPFLSQPKADHFAATHGRVTSNSVIPVWAVPDGQTSLFDDMAGARAS